MPSRFTLGVEEEFQMVERDTGRLASHVETILHKGAPVFGECMKPEMLQSVVEIISGVCSDVHELRQDLSCKREHLKQILEGEGLVPISAGTHPEAHWRDQRSTVNPRYEELEDELQDVARSILICGMHVHVGIDSHEIALPLMNQLRTWLPHLLALSSNSPFWISHYTGIKSYRSIVWKRFPRSGIPPIFVSTADFDAYVADLMRTGSIDNAKKIWWDIRPHPFFNTIEFRICDMPGTFEDTMAIAALCQALVCKHTWLYEHNMSSPVLPAHYIEENKWKASRYGLDAIVVDFPRNRRLTMRESLYETLDFVADVVEELGIQREIQYLRTLVEQPNGTGADRQIAIYNETRSIHEVTKYLMKRTMHSATPIDLTLTDPQT